MTVTREMKVTQCALSGLSSLCLQVELILPVGGSTISSLSVLSRRFREKYFLEEHLKPVLCIQYWVVRLTKLPNAMELSTTREATRC
jgi:hypothetical protein